MTNKDIPSIKLDRSIFTLKENSYVKYMKDIYKISSIINFTEVIGIDIKTKRPKRLFIKDLTPVENEFNNDSIFKDIDEITDEEFMDLQKKYLSIQPLLTNSITRVEIEEYSKKIGVHFTTIYRWLKQYRTTGTLAGLLTVSFKSATIRYYK
ncbi:helix-turn-helix domain-containing protein [Arcobacter caeni]|uniref:Helix-turn-helix domain-containing protein n=1 Tax=Arcobacter caeni TaxID=1912877 RepID=A0A363D2N2_9BACT|nr:helix-turn-helix domain-containing protein [Arcobacter caeni]PUE65493.1 hypothetical protein B0174_04005 [Arcobacter caeni]